ncbi:MAG: hypothetical protein PHE43_04335 [Candidatus Nanoarchaeia archaeon]|nr:hypothetical protein [Candidatus Nanoarchaeia archaeon]
MKRGLLTFALIILSVSASAIIIQPPKIEINFQPNQESYCTFSALNNADSSKEFTLEARGYLNQSIVLEDNILLEPQKWTDISCKILPISEIPPGTHESSIVMIESQGSSGVVGAVGGVELKIYTYFPYPGKYIDGNIIVDNSEINKQIPVSVKVINRGREVINNLEAEISIKSNNEEVAKLKIPSTSLNLLEEKTLTTYWQTSDPGEYSADARVYFDQNHINFEKKFKVGAPIIEIQDILSDELKQDTISKVEVKLKSFWNAPIENTYVELLIKKDSEYISQSKSSQTTFGPWEEKIIEVYFDTTDYEPKIYPGKVIVYYEGKQAEKEVMLEVTKPKLNLITISLIIIIVLLISLLIFSLIKKKHEKK